MPQRKTHPRRKVEPAECFYDEDFVHGEQLGTGTFIPTLKHLTPIVGDTIMYETWAGDLLHPYEARKRLDAGQIVYYTTWEVTE